MACHAGRIPAPPRGPGSAAYGGSAANPGVRSQPPPEGIGADPRRLPAPSRGTGRRPPVLGYFGGITRTDPIRIFVGSTVGFAAISEARLIPSFCEIAHIVSFFLTV